VGVTEFFTKARCLPKPTIHFSKCTPPAPPPYPTLTDKKFHWVTCPQDIEEFFCQYSMCRAKLEVRTSPK